MRAFEILWLLLPALAHASETIAVLGCPREDGTVTALSERLVETLVSGERSRPEARLVDRETVGRVLRGQRLRGSEDLSASMALKLGSYLDAGRLVASSYRVEDGRVVVRTRAYETLTGSLERRDSSELALDTGLSRLDAAVLEPAPETMTSPAQVTAHPVPLRTGSGPPPLELDGCRFGELGARCRGFVRSRKGGAFRLLRDGSRFAYDNGLRGPLAGWTLGGAADPVRLDPDSAARLEFDVGISLLHSGPREFHYFLLRYQVGDELWEWSGIPPVLGGP